jgi:hypothetical protein
MNDETFNDTAEPNFNGFTDEQLAGVLRFTERIATINQDIVDAVEQAKTYARERNANRSGKIQEDDEESKSIREQVSEFLIKTKRKVRE